MNIFWYLIFSIALFLPIKSYAADCQSDFSTDEEMISDIKHTKDFQLSDGEIQVITTDVNMDGNSDRLIGYDCGNAGCTYNIFLQSKPGHFHYAGKAFFYADSYKILKNKDANVLDMLFYWSLGSQQGELIEYHITCLSTTEVAKVSGTNEDLYPFISSIKTPISQPSQSAP